MCEFSDKFLCRQENPLEFLSLYTTFSVLVATNSFQFAKEWSILKFERYSHCKKITYILLQVLRNPKYPKKI